MTYIPDTQSKYETKYCNNKVRKIPNFYYRGLVVDNPFVLGYQTALQDLESAFSENLNGDERTIDELERSIQRDFISDVHQSMANYEDMAIVSIIDGMEDEEHKARMEKIFGQEFTDYLEDEEEFELSVKEGQDLLKKLIAVESKIEEA